MDEILISGAVIAIVLLIAIIVYLHEKYWDCYHRWGPWRLDDDEIAYVQYRECEKCGYTEIEQHRKLKEKS